MKAYPKKIVIAIITVYNFFALQGVATADVINTGTTLQVNNDLTGVLNGFLLPGSVTLNGGTLLSNNALNLPLGLPFLTVRPILLNTAGGNLSATSGTSATYSGAISNGNGTTGVLTIGSALKTGTVIFAAANSYTGGTTILGGTLGLSGSGTLGATTNALGLLGGGLLDLGGTNQSCGVLTLGSGGLINSSTGIATLNSSGVVVSGAANTIGSGVNLVGAITQNSNSSLTVNGVAGADSLAASATLNGAGTLGPVIFAGTNTISSSSTLNLGGLTVNGTGNTIGSGTIVGDVVFGNSSALAVNGTLNGAVNIGNGVLSGAGSISGVVTSNGGLLTGSGLQLTSGATVNGAGNTIGGTVTGNLLLAANASCLQTGTLTGNVSQLTASGLTVNGVVGTDDLALSATLNGTGTLGAVTFAGNNSLSSAGTLTTGGIAVSGSGNIITSGNITGPITQTLGSTLTVNGTAGTDSLALLATLSGTGTIGALNLAGSNVLSSTGTLTTGGITVNGASNLISGGTVTGSITQNSNSALTVNGTAGNDTLGLQATLSGTGTVGTVNLTGNNVLSSASTLATAGINVSGTGNWITTGNVTGAITQSVNSLLTVNGVGGNDALSSSATLSGTGSVGVVTLSGNDTLNSTATLFTNGLIVNGTGNLISNGGISGAITQNSNSGLTVNWIGGNDSLAASASLNGIGAVGAVTLAGNDTLSSAATLHLNSLAVSGTGNTIASGNVAVDAVLGNNAALIVNGTLERAANVGNGSLSGSGSVNGLATVNGGTISGSGLNLLTGATFNGIGNTLGGTVNGNINLAVNASLTQAGALNGTSTQLAGSTLTVNGTLSADVLQTSANLNGNGTIGTVTLNGGDGISSSGTLHTSGITVNGTGNLVGSGIVTGNVLVNQDASLIVTGVASGQVMVGAGGTLGGTGTLGAVTVAGGGNLNLQDGSIGNLTVGGLTIGSSGLPTKLSVDIQTQGGVTTIDKITDIGTLNLGGLGGTTISIGGLAGTTFLNVGTYTLISATNILGSLGDISLTTTVLDNQTLTLTLNGTSLDLTVGALPSGAPYTLTATAANSRIMVNGGSTNITSTLNNVGSTDSLDYVGLNASASSGLTAGGTLPATGGPVAAGSSVSGTTILTSGSTTGAVTITPTVISTLDTTLGGTSTLAGTTAATVDVVANRVVTANGVSFGRVMVGQAVNATSTLSTTGSDANFTRVTVGTTGPDANGISATGGSNPVFNSASSMDTRSVGGIFSTAGNVNNTLTLTTTGEGLAGEAPINVSLNYSADAVNKRTIVNGATTDLGTLHVGSAVNVTTNAFTTTGLNNTTTSVAVGAGSGVADINGIALTGGVTTFDGSTMNASGTRTLTGTIKGNGAMGNTFNLLVSTLENGGAGLAGEGSYTPVSIGYTALVYSGQGVWTGNGSGSWGTIVSHPNFSTAGGAPGLDPNFTTTDTALFGDSVGASAATVTLNGDSPSLKGITFNNNLGGSYTIAQGSGGILKLNAGAGATATVLNIAGDNTINAPVELDSNAAVTVSAGQTLTLSGPISEGGSPSALTYNGPGTIILSGANTYTGGTILNSGNLNVVNAGTLGASAAPLTLGGGILDLGNTSQNVGVVTISGPATLQNGILNGSSFIDSSASGNTLITASLVGLGGLQKTGGGTLFLNGLNSFSGGTSLGGGVVKIGNLNAFGNGDVSMSAGTLETGNGVHQINVNGNYNQTGGTLVLNLTGLGAGATPGYEFLNVTGTAHLGGGLLVSVSSPYVPVIGDTFTFVQAPTITGGFTNIQTNLFSLSITRQGMGVIIGQLPFSTLPTINYTPNELAVATYIDQVYQSGMTSPGFQTLMGTLNGLTAAGDPQDALPTAMSQISPERFFTFASATQFNNAIFQSTQINSYLDYRRNRRGEFISNDTPIDSTGLTVNDPSVDSAISPIRSELLAWNPAPPSDGLLSDSSALPSMTSDPKKMTETDTEDESSETPLNESSDPLHIFVQGNVTLAQGLSQVDVPHSDTSTESIRLGGDYEITKHFLVGSFFDYSHTDGTLDNQGSTASVDSYSPGVYASFADGGWYANGLAAYSFDNYTENRQISFLGSEAKSSPSGQQVRASLTTGYDFHVHGWTFGPTLGAQFTNMNIDSFTESGSDAALKVDGATADSFRSLLGARLKYEIQACGLTFRPHLSASWQHEFLDQSRGITSSFNDISDGTFIVRTPGASGDAALIDLGANLDLNRTVTIFADYAAQVGQSNYIGQSFQVGVRVGF